jgi:hypothetical protein
MKITGHAARGFKRRERGAPRGIAAVDPRWQAISPGGRYRADARTGD